MVDKRLRYFDGQFLQDQDFIDEQDYHLDRERRPLKCLTIAGVCEGLTVNAPGRNQVTVAPGMAIDARGRQMVLESPEVVDLSTQVPQAGQTKQVNLFIAYHEEASDPATEGSQGNRRWYEKPQITVLDDSAAQPENAVNLARLTVEADGDVIVDASVCEYSGMHLPNGNGNGATLRYQSDGNGSRPILTGDLTVSGDVGIGTTNSPRSALDTGVGVMTGAANDYQKAQLTLSGGGTVTWTWNSSTEVGRLKWTQRFTATTMERSVSFPDGRIDIDQPTSDIPAAQVYDGQGRSVTGDGIELKGWEALYAVHTVGGNKSAVSFRIEHLQHNFYAPSNWLLIAIINGDNHTVKLGTGTIVSANSSSSNGSPLPSGTILMWSGSETDIPDGWALCNGENGTPDLRDRFILCAGTNDISGSSGDATGHTHDISINISTNTNGGGEHNHKFPHWFNKSGRGGGGYGVIDISIAGGGSLDGYQVTRTDGSHSHSLSYSQNLTSSGSSIPEIRPKWYALCFILKL
ncbi:MAG: hypothetical protein AB4426_04940 [Xenococcaceae cyanobacterium]